MYRKIKTALKTASRAILTAPVQLPRKVVQIAKYVALAIGILDAVERPESHARDQQEGDTDEGEPAA